MIYYFDTSALLKRYLLEEGTQGVLELFRQKDYTVVTSSITLVEGYHGICRKCREESVSIRVQERILRDLKKDLSNAKIVEFNALVIKQAQKIIGNHPIRTLDAIHIASALVFHPRKKLKIQFISCDEKQCVVALKQGLSVFNPLGPVPSEIKDQI